MLCFMQDARSQDSSMAYIVSYFETTQADASRAADLARQLTEQSRKEDGNVRFEALQRLEQPNHFAILEAWKSKEAQAAHAAAAHTTQFRQRLASLLRSPYDERPHTGLSVGSSAAPAKTGSNKAAIYVVTHVDVIPTEKEKGIQITKELADASRGSSGNARFEVLQQNSRPNHMTVVEVWENAKAIDAHGGAAPTKLFREKLTPMSGSLYDERLYRLLN
jgi:quinol monooxygenase YgiN